MGQKTTQDGEPGTPEPKKLDLSAAQVAGSSLATVAAALLASQMGVYGTILGAGVVSVVATAGGPVIQHFFRRTGDQLRDTARSKSPSRRVPTAGAAAEPGPPTEVFGAATVHGTRVRGWRRTAVAAGAAFAISMGALGTYEAVAGTSVSSDGGTIFSGGTRTVDQDKPAAPEEKPGKGTGTGDGGKDGKSPGSGTSPHPSGSPGTGGGRSPSPGTGTPHPGESSPGPTPSKSAPTPPPTPPATPSPDAPPSGSGAGGSGGSGSGASRGSGATGGSGASAGQE